MALLELLYTLYHLIFEVLTFFATRLCHPCRRLICLLWKNLLNGCRCVLHRLCLHHQCLILQLYCKVLTALIFLVLEHIIALEQIDHLASIYLNLLFFCLISLIVYLGLNYLVIQSKYRVLLSIFNCISHSILRNARPTSFRNQFIVNMFLL
jgi:hypothetical protein